MAWTYPTGLTYDIIFGNGRTDNTPNISDDYNAPNPIWNPNPEPSTPYKWLAEHDLALNMADMTDFDQNGDGAPGREYGADTVNIVIEEPWFGGIFGDTEWIMVDDIDVVNFVLPTGWSIVFDPYYDPVTAERFGTNLDIFNADGIQVSGDTSDDSEQDQFWISRNFVICFTRGTELLCADGVERRIEALRIGDQVMTRDNGLQTIRWISSTTRTAESLAQFPNLRPIRIKAGALGNDRDLLVSPQHRMMVSGELAEAIEPGTSEVLVAAKALVNDRNILIEPGHEGVEYFHILFDNHELVLANGAWSESFLPRPYSMTAIDRAAFHELVELFPELEETSEIYGANPRPTVKPGQLRQRLKKAGREVSDYSVVPDASKPKIQLRMPT